jgi:7-cyano-7-deazaguanine synthase
VRGSEAAGTFFPRRIGHGVPRVTATPDLDRRRPRLLAYRRGARHLVTGVCETDFSGYPDCRDDTMKAMQLALNLGMESRFVIHTPLIWIDKAQTWSLARDLGGDRLVDLIREDTHTCYNGDREHRHDWGFGCGTCPACELRAAGYQRFIAL